MKKRKDKITKGTSQAMVLSILIHVGLFLLAGMLVIFTVVQTKEVEFEPPQAVERPKMKLKKPKVKIKQSSKPKTAKIASKSPRSVMPAIEVPEIGGMGDGFGGIEGVDLMPDFAVTETLFGSEQSIGNDLEGTFYDFNRRRIGSVQNRTQAEVADLINKFFKNGWDPFVWNDVYRSEKKLYATTIAFPLTPSDDAPDAFGESDAKSWLWLVHYKGKIVYPEDITFRFWSFCDDIVAVRINDEFVHLNCFPRWVTHFEEATRHHWQSSSGQNRSFDIGNNKAVIGDWITLNALEPADIEILIGENVGGLFGALMLVEVKGVDYETSQVTQMPILPVFKTEQLTRDQIESIYWYLPESEGTVAGGPIFNDIHDPAEVDSNEPPEVVLPPEAAATDASQTNSPAQLLADMRTWKLSDGKTVDGKYMTLMRDMVVMENRQGKQAKVPLSALSEEDLELVAMKNPPQFELNFKKASRQLDIRPVSMNGGDALTRKYEYEFGFTARQMNQTPYYTHPLIFEYYAIATETDGNNYMLIDRQEITYDPPVGRERREYAFDGEKPIEIKQFRTYGDWRGVQYKGYLIVVRDKDGTIIQHKASNEFLFEGLSNLQHVPVGRRFNKDCNRVMPPRPKSNDVPDWRGSTI